MDFNNALVAALAGAVIAGIVSLIIGRMQIKRTDRANRIADEALKLAKEANAYQEHVDPRRFAPWSTVQCHEDDRYYFSNQTSRPAWVDQVIAEETKAQGLLHAESNVRVDPGDTYSFFALHTLAGGVDRVIIRWHWDGDETSHDVRREVLT